jgi:O-antigen ligase
VDDTIAGEHFWAGKGYGINLATEQGYQDESGLRSPHNVHMTILARSGVPGLILWALFLISFVWLLLKESITRRRGADAGRREYAIWILAYLTAFLFNATFDVFLEGPMGGVWFWSIIGMALVYFTRENYRAGAIQSSGKLSASRTA